MLTNVVVAHDLDENGRVSTFNSLHKDMNNVQKSIEMSCTGKVRVTRKAEHYGVVRFYANGRAVIEARYQPVNVTPLHL